MSIFFEPISCDSLRDSQAAAVTTGISLPQLASPGSSLHSSRTSQTPPRAPDQIRAQRRMIDSHGRTIRDLRISITDRCNFRCVYCMEPDVRFVPSEELLQPDEFIRIARIAESLGVRKIRITGGEPTLHPHLTDIIAGIRQSTSVEIALITNASRLSRDLLKEWKHAGLARITISIDTLRPDRFASLTRSATSPGQVLAGVEMCLAESLTPLKLNAVLIRGLNDDEAPDLAQLARRYGIEMRFIEYMPLDSASAWEPSKYVPASETLAAIQLRYPLIATGRDDVSSTSRTYAFADGTPGLVGFIAPVSSPFCGACSRLRLTADGKVRPCLFSTQEWELRTLLRDSDAAPSDEQIADYLIDAAWSKQAGHGISSPDFAQPQRPMSAIGG